MKSVSIVYRRSKNKDTDGDGDKSKPKEFRRAMDEYYSKMTEKSKNKSELIQKIRSHTAKASRVQDRKKVFSSLSIAAIIPPPTPQIPVKSNTERKITKASLFNVKRTKQNFFTLNLPETTHEHDQSPIVFKRGFKQSSTRHAKLKILQRPKCLKEATLVLSADLVYNQSSFWSEEFIDESCCRVWKTLSSVANIIWIVKRESTYRKLVSFASSFNFKIDGVVQVEPNKKQSLTISYANLEQEMKLPRSHKLLIINTLRNESLLDLREEQFRYSLPVISHPSTFVHFVQVDMNDKNRFSCVRKIVNKPLPDPFDLGPIIAEHVEKKGKIIQRIEIDEESLCLSPGTILDKIEAMKQKFLTQFSRNIGLSTKLQNGDSVNYLIGDMLKRNYGTIKGYYNFCRLIEQRKQEQAQQLVQEGLSRKINRVEYKRHVYVWNFL